MHSSELLENAGRVFHIVALSTGAVCPVSGSVVVYAECSRKLAGGHEAAL